MFGVGGGQGGSRSALRMGLGLGPQALGMIANLCFTLFVGAVLLFTILAATYEPDDPLFHPSSSQITSFLTSTSSNATFASDLSLLKTGEDFPLPSPHHSAAFSSFINLTDLPSIPPADCNLDLPVDCRDPEVFHLLMKSAIERFPDIHFYRFGKPVPGPDPDPITCDIAWRFRPKQSNTASFYKDYRRFTLSRSSNCILSVSAIGDYHSGVLARKKRKNQAPGFEKRPLLPEELKSLPVVGEAASDTLPQVASEGSFSHGKYLLYTGGGDRCKDMNHFLWSFLCALGEAQYLNRTLVMDLTMCLSSTYSSANQDEEGKDFRFYFDFEHLKESASVLDQDQFWTDWNKWQKRDGLSLFLVEDVRVTPMKLMDVKDALVMRKFGSVEPDNYWYRVCEGETESVVQRPWHLIWKSKRLMDIVSAIATRLNWDYDAVHIERGDKARNKDLWPNLDEDTSPKALVSTLRDKVDDGRNLYIATNEGERSLFEALKDRYSTHFLEEYKDLWDESSEWYAEMTNLNKGAPVEFDGYMKVAVDTEVFLRGKKQIETFNDLTKDCKDGINTCTTAASA